MLCNERGLQAGSDFYFFTPSDMAKSLLFYPTSCDSFCADFGYQVTRDNYYNFLCLYVKEGSLSVTNEGKTAIVGKGMICFINCYKPHAYHATGYTKFLWLHFDGSNTSNFHDLFLKNHSGFIKKKDNQLILSTLQHIVTACRANQILSEAEYSKKVYHLLLDLLGEGGVETDKAQNSTTDRAITYIQKYYAKPICLQDIADEVNMSVYHFSRVFKNKVGFSPHEFLIKTRLDTAKYLLKTTDDPIKSIAYAVGYNNESGFITAFTNKVGISPGKFRRFPI